MFRTLLSIPLALLAITMNASAADRELPELPKPITSLGAVVDNGQVYVFGGHSGKAHSYSNETTLNTFQRLKLTKPVKWEELASGPVAQGLALVAHDGGIIRVGGMQPRNTAKEKTDAYSIDSVSRFDPKTGKWSDLPAMPAGRSSHDAVVIGDKLYVAGGWQMNGAGKDSVWHDKTLVLDLKKTDAGWEKIEQPFKRRALTMAAHNGKVYVIAGLTSEGKADRSVNIYDPEQKTWSKGAEIPDGPMNGFTPAACVADGKLYLSPADGKVYRLDEKGTEWAEAGALAHGRIVHRLVPAGNGRLLAIGGSVKGAPVGDVEEVVVK